jgi:hypothetical protein
VIFARFPAASARKPPTGIRLEALSGRKPNGARESSGKYSGNEHKLQKRPEWQGRRPPAANRQVLASRAYVRREKPDQQQRQAGRGDGRDRGDE